MSGSTPALIAIPIVVTILLAAWLIMVFYAASHPQWRGRGSAPARSNSAPAARGDLRRNPKPGRRKRKATTGAPEPAPAQDQPAGAPRLTIGVSAETKE